MTILNFVIFCNSGLYLFDALCC